MHTHMIIIHTLILYVVGHTFGNPERINKEGDFNSPAEYVCLSVYLCVGFAMFGCMLHGLIMSEFAE